jgi:hypothetical protein
MSVTKSLFAWHPSLLTVIPSAYLAIYLALKVGFAFNENLLSALLLYVLPPLVLISTIISLKLVIRATKPRYVALLIYNAATCVWAIFLAYILYSMKLSEPFY